jgi:hypothetical protein
MHSASCAARYRGPSPQPAFTRTQPRRASWHVRRGSALNSGVPYSDLILAVQYPSDVWDHLSFLPAPTRISGALTIPITPGPGMDAGPDAETRTAVGRESCALCSAQTFQDRVITGACPTKGRRIVRTRICLFYCPERLSLAKAAEPISRLWLND